MKQFWPALFMLGTLVWSTPVAAEGFETGNDLLSDCEHEIGKVYCQGYIIGVADMQAISTIRGDTSCLPAGVTNGQVADVAIAWLRDHPELRHHGAAGLVSAALMDSFPC